MGFNQIVQGASPSFQVGKLRHRIQIVRPTFAQDSTGGFVLTNTTPVAECWASIEALTASEKFAAHEFVSQVTHKIWLRYTSSYRVVAQDQVIVAVPFSSPRTFRLFQVEGVLNPDERNKMLCLMAIEVNDSVQQPVTGPGDLN